MTAGQSLIIAARRGHIDQLASLLRMGVGVNTISMHTTALAESARHGNIDCVVHLLRAGADVNLPRVFNTPIMQALMRPNNHFCVDLLMSAKDGVQNHVRQHGRTTLMSAAIGGYSAAALKILGKVPNAQEALSMCDDSKNTALTYAAMNGRVRFIREVIFPHYNFSNETANAVAIEKHFMLRHLLLCYDDVEAVVNRCENNELTPLALSVILDNEECTRLLLENQACLDTVDGNGRHALIYAGACGSLRCLKMLIAAGATIEWVDKHFQSALTIVCKNGHSECLHVLLDALKQGEAAESTENRSVSSTIARLAMVTLRRSYQAIKVLTRRGGGRLRITSEEREIAADWSLPRSLSNDLDESDRGGMTPLDYACKNGHLQCVFHLLRAGVDPNKGNKIGLHPLMIAAHHGHMRIAHELYRANADVNAVDQLGNTALFYATDGNNIDFVKFLLRCGASATLKNNTGLTAITQAASCGYHTSLKFLLKQKNRTVRNYLNAKREEIFLGAAENGQTHCMWLLLQFGARFDSRQYYACLSAVRAVEGGHLETLRFLIHDMGVSINQLYLHGFSLVSVACRSQSPIPLFRYLISSGAPFDLPVPKAKLTPLMLTCLKGNIEMTQSLLNLGACTFNRDCCGYTPLIHALEGRNARCITLVLEAEDRRGLQVADIWHRRALIYAIGLHSTPCIKVFLENSVFVWKWYYYCSAHTHHDSRILLSSLVNSSIPPGIFWINNERFSPLKYALRHSAFDSVKFLLANLYLTDHDYKDLPRNANMRQLLNKDHTPSDQAIVDALVANPWPLSTLSFVAVSSAITAQYRNRFCRRGAVNTLSIPEFFKRKLAFTEHTTRICISDWPRLHQGPLRPASSNCILKVTNDTNMWSTYLVPCEDGECCCQKTGLVLEFES